jgi:PhnB protein
MTIKKVTPSLTFDGKAAKAIELYERALGATVERLMRFGDAPPTGPTTPDAHKNRVMYAMLRVGDDAVMVMDAPPGVAVATASNVQVALELDDAAEMARRFDALSAGGVITIAPHDAFWGARFGMLIDAFGIRWMLSGPTTKA